MSAKSLILSLALLLSLLILTTPLCAASGTRQATLSAKAVAPQVVIRDAPFLRVEPMSTNGASFSKPNILIPSSSAARFDYPATPILDESVAARGAGLDASKNNLLGREQNPGNDSPHRDPAERDSVLYQTGFENGWEDWTTADLTIQETKWHSSQTHAYQGRSWWCADEEVGGYENHWLQYLETPVLNLTNRQNLKLTFKVNWAVEDPRNDAPPDPYNGWDGCNVWISTDAGQTWRVLSPTRPAYTQSSLYSFGYEWKMGPNIPGWCGSSGQWQNAEFSLANYARANVRIRWAFCSDPAFATPDDSSLFGLVVDNLNITAGNDTVWFNNGNEQGDMSFDHGPTAGNFWELSQADRHSGAVSAHCAVHRSLEDALISPAFQVPDAPWQTWFDFWVHTDMPAWDPNGDQTLDDYFNLDVSTDGTTWERVVYDYGRDAGWQDNWHYFGPDTTFNANLPQWKRRLELTPFAGQAIQLRWVVETDTNMTGDQGTGLWIDDFRVNMYGGFADDNEGVIGSRWRAGDTYFDYQTNGSLGRCIALDDSGGIHLTWMDGYDSQNQTRHQKYNFFNGQSWLAQDGNPVDNGSRSGYGCLTLTNESPRRPLVFCHVMRGNILASEVFLDNGQGVGAFSGFRTPQFADLYNMWPQGVMSPQGTLHIVANTSDARRISWSSGGIVDGERIEFNQNEPIEVALSQVVNSRIVSSPRSERVAMTYLRPLAGIDPPAAWNGYLASQMYNDLMLVWSDDGVNWNFDDPVNITNCIPPDPEREGRLAYGDTLYPYSTHDIIFDSEDKIHVVFDARGLWVQPTPSATPPVDGLTMDKSYLFHWSEATNRITAVADGWFSQTVLDSNGDVIASPVPGAWLSNVCSPSLGYAPNGDLYCVYNYHPYNDYVIIRNGSGACSGDIAVTVSEDNGVSWSVPTMLTTTSSLNSQEGGARSEHYCSQTEVVDDALHISYVTDTWPGTSVQSQGEPNTLCPVYYQRVPVNLINREVWDGGPSFHINLGAPALSHFTNFTITDVSHSLLITGFTSDGQEAPTGWEVGVFTPDGVLAGGGVWENGDRLGMAVWSDDAVTEDVVEGFHAGERMTFRGWDYETDQEFACTPTVERGSVNWEANGWTVLSLASSRQIVVQMKAGWNTMSINVVPTRQFWRRDEGPDVPLMVEQLRVSQNHHHVMLMKDDMGRFYNPQWAYNNIPYWNLTKGYQVKVDDSVAAVWSGTPIAADAPIPLNNGWNTIAYFPTYQLSASSPSFYVLSNIIEHVMLAKDDIGRFMFPRSNYSNMIPWREGKGYQLKVNQAIELRYPAERERLAASSEPETTPGHWPQPTRTGSSMSVLLILECGVQNAECSEIGAFTNSGLCVGSAFASASASTFGLAVWGDDPTTPEVDGLAEGEPFRLIRWNETAKREEALAVGAVKEGKGLIYEQDGFAASEVSIAGLPTEYSLNKIYPNPFNTSTIIKFDLPEAGRIHLAVYDLAGRETAVLESGVVEAGRYARSWDGSACSAGLYIVRLEANGRVFTAKALLLK